MTTRRTFLGALAGGLLGVPRAAQAQPARKAYRVGWLSPASAANGLPNLDALRAGLRDLGYVEGRNITIEARWADGEVPRLPRLAAELVGRFVKDRKALPALALNANSSSLTAISNDYAYSKSFSKQVEAFVIPGDVVFGISTSGNSENVVEALKTARAAGAVTVGLTGQGGGKVGEHSDILLAVPSGTVARIQESHILVGHIICELVESALFPDPDPAS